MERTLRKILVFTSIFPLYFLSFGLIKQNSKLYFKKILKAIFYSGIVLNLIALIQFLLQFIIGKEPIMNFYANYLAPFIWGKAASQAVIENPSWLFNAGFMDLLRSFATLPDPHMLSFTLCFMLPVQGFFLFKAIKKNQKTKTFIYALIILSSFLVEFLTFSRGGYLGFLGGLGLCFSLIFILKDQGRLFSQYKKLIFRVFALISIFFLSLIVFYQNPITQRLISSFNLEEGSNLGRLKIWSQALNVYAKNPIIGGGLGSYSYQIDASFAYRDPIYAHNLYLEFLAEIGLIGLILWLGLIFFCFYLSFKTIKKIKSSSFRFFLILIISAFFWYSIHAFFEIPLYSPVVLSYLMFYFSFTTSLASDVVDPF
jgi:O-antigen ligase